MKNKINKIFENLDKWVSLHGTKRYIPENYEENIDDDFNMSENFGIWQVRKEIYEFSKVLLKNKSNICLEIGLGYYGSTHFLFRHMFNKVITIEYQKERVFSFRESANSFYNKFIFGDRKSKFIFGSSHEPSSVEKLDTILKNEKLDLLFIDGDHSYKGVLTDYLIYKDFVKKGGIIAFHDTLNKINNKGVRKCLEKIKKLDSKIKLKNIFHSKTAGISYFIKK